MKNGLVFSILIICFISRSFLFAQSKEKIERDSLLNVLSKAKDDTNKVNIYSSVIYLFVYSDNKEGLKYERPALKLAEKLKWKIGIAKIKNYTGRIYWHLGKFDEALKRHFEALKIYIEENDQLNIAEILNSIGQDYADAGEYSKALIYFAKSLRQFEEVGNELAIANTYNLISWVHVNQGDYIESSKSNYAALKIYEKIGDKYGEAVSYSSLADDFKNLGNYSEAIKYNLKSIELLKDVNDVINLAYSYNNLGIIYTNLGNYPEAFKNHMIALNISRKVTDKFMIAQSHVGIGNVYQSQGDHTRALANYVKAESNFKSISNKQELSKLYSSMGLSYTRLKKYDEAKKNFDEALALSKELNSKMTLRNYYEGVELLDSANGNWENAYKNYKQFIIINDSILGRENLKKLVVANMQYETDKKEAAAKVERDKKEAIAKVEQDKKEAAAKMEQDKKDIRQKNIRIFISTILAGALIFLVVVLFQRNKISNAKKQSEELLLNILPAETAEELKKTGTTKAKEFEEVTVMFTDFKNFTSVSETLTAQELVNEINYCYSEFDKIITKNNIEKIKTIGDAYMCAGGLPIPNKTNALDTVNAAIEIRDFMLKENEERKKEGKSFFEIRIGLHTGPVVAGIVGIKKFAYDIWGDTVNIAARMESSGEAGKVNISGTTYELIKDKFTCTYRGKIEAKGKGEVDMFFVSVD